MMNPNGHVTVTGWTLPDTPNARGVLQPSEQSDFRIPSGEYGMVTHANSGQSKLNASLPACDSCGRTDTPCESCEREAVEAIRHG